ncbi:hypothetical protein Pelo_5676 [Pelomyxa schiedti]|nr:hypothetical protein Pelo_5676 [Pelomyxa schiedti]
MGCVVNKYPTPDSHVVSRRSSPRSSPVRSDATKEGTVRMCPHNRVRSDCTLCGQSNLSQEDARNYLREVGFPDLRVQDYISQKWNTQSQRPGIKLEDLVGEMLAYMRREEGMLLGESIDYIDFSNAATAGDYGEIAYYSQTEGEADPVRNSYSDSIFDIPSSTNTASHPLPQNANSIPDNRLPESNNANTSTTPNSPESPIAMHPQPRNDTVSPNQLPPPPALEPPNNTTANNSNNHARILSDELNRPSTAPQAAEQSYSNSFSDLSADCTGTPPLASTTPVSLTSSIGSSKSIKIFHSRRLHVANRGRASQGHHSADRCVVCYLATVNSAFAPCGHMGLCCSCAKAIMSKTSKCPFCRETISSVVQIFKM